MSIEYDVTVSGKIRLSPDQLLDLMPCILCI